MIGRNCRFSARRETRCDYRSNVNIGRISFIFRTLFFHSWLTFFLKFVLHFCLIFGGQYENRIEVNTIIVCIFSPCAALMLDWEFRIDSLVYTKFSKRFLLLELELNVPSRYFQETKENFKIYEQPTQQHSSSTGIDHVAVNFPIKSSHACSFFIQV